jgi:hypothetical protein
MLLAINAIRWIRHYNDYVLIGLADRPVNPEQQKTQPRLGFILSD